MAVAEPTRENELRTHFLVLRCQAGDERAFEALLDAFGPRTLRYLRSLLADDAEDAQQEVWLAVYRSITTLADARAFRTWLFSATRRRAIDHLRRKRREGELFADVPYEDAAADDADPGFDAAQLDAMLAELPAPQREVLLLRYRDEMTYSEIALIVGCPVGTVRTRLHHAKRKVKELLQRGSQ
jgi:RNA polymerase sigma-70 factor, ECF subfamily